MLQSTLFRHLRLLPSRGSAAPPQAPVTPLLTTAIPSTSGSGSFDTASASLEQLPDDSLQEHAIINRDVERQQQQVNSISSLESSSFANSLVDHTCSPQDNNQNVTPNTNQYADVGASATSSRNACSSASSQRLTHVAAQTIPFPSPSPSPPLSLFESQRQHDHTATTSTAASNASQTNNNNSSNSHDHEQHDDDHHHHLYTNNAKADSFIMEVFPGGVHKLEVFFVFPTFFILVCCVVLRERFLLEQLDKCQ
jgi:hypothetical protein